MMPNGLDFFTVARILVPAIFFVANLTPKRVLKSATNASYHRIRTLMDYVTMLCSQVGLEYIKIQTLLKLYTTYKLP